MTRHLAAGAVFGLTVSTMPAGAGQMNAVAQERVVPIVATRHPSRASVTGKRTIDIPQAAKDAGHNGSATWTATIGADGALTGLTLKDSSNSPAIDAAAKAWAEQARYIAATDASGAKVPGSVEIHLSYEPWDEDSDGSLSSYRCRDLVRDADWFAAANGLRQRIFWLENAYTSLPSLRLMEQGVVPSRQEREAGRTRASQDWKKLISRCRKAPEQLILDLVDDRDFYRRVVESF